jgi:hypothetical protein
MPHNLTHAQQYPTISPSSHERPTLLPITTPHQTPPPPHTHPSTCECAPPPPAAAPGCALRPVHDAPLLHTIRALLIATGSRRHRLVNTAAAATGGDAAAVSLLGDVGGKRPAGHMVKQTTGEPVEHETSITQPAQTSTPRSTSGSCINQTALNICRTVPSLDTTACGMAWHYGDI